MYIQELDRPLMANAPKKRSSLEWKINLPFMWIDAAAANDTVEKENLLRGAVARNDAWMHNSNKD